MKVFPIASSIKLNKVEVTRELVSSSMALTWQTIGSFNNESQFRKVELEQRVARVQLFSELAKVR